ncbi:MAG: hypothetical protein H6695_19110 [Deferribacteres bacterium]|nr:hypothetical protein [candidate division KSB1 bacterium]MCB9512297.1 hypothetical protein [Deferribacteres bacterium]
MQKKTGISYFGNRNPRHFLIDLEEMISHHCSFVLHTFSENDQLFYQATMAEMVGLSKGAGLEVYLAPWGVGRVFGGEAFSDYALKNRSTCQKLFSGELAPAACLNTPAFAEFMMKWIDDAAELGADVIFWGEPHFYHEQAADRAVQDWACMCDSCKKKFKIFYGENFPLTPNDDFFRFREDSMVEFLATLCAYAKTKNLKNSICLLPMQEKAFGVSDWEKIAQISELDILATDPYWIAFDRNLEYVSENAKRIVNLSKRYNLEPQLLIQNFKIPKGRESEILEAIAIAYAEGVRNIAGWSFYGSEYMSYLKCDNPKDVWDLLGEVFGKIQSGDWD